MTTNEQRKEDVFNKPSAKFFIFGSIILLVLHVLSGYLQLPQQVINVGLSRGFKVSHIKIGYAIGIFLIFAILLPIVISILLLLYKKRRNLLSFSKILFWSLFVTLFFNFLMGFILVPKMTYK